MSKLRNTAQKKRKKNVRCAAHFDEDRDDEEYFSSGIKWEGPDAVEDEMNFGMGDLHRTIGAQQDLMAQAGLKVKVEEEGGEDKYEAMIKHEEHPDDIKFDPGDETELELELEKARLREKQIDIRVRLLRARRQG